MMIVGAPRRVDAPSAASGWLEVRSHPVESGSVVEGAPIRTGPGIQGTDLEVLSPLGAWRPYTEGLGQLEAESLVVARIAEQNDGGLIEGVSGREDVVHESVTDTAALMVRQYPERSESERRAVVDARAAAHHVTNYLVVELSDDRQLGDDVAVVSQSVNETCFRSFGAIGTRERRRMNGKNRGSVGRRFAAQDHQCSLVAA